MTLTDIGEGDTAALLCLTDREQCCRTRDGNAAGNWYFPNGSQVQAGAGSGSIYRTRNASRVQLNREDAAQSPTGVYRCEVPDANGTDRSIYVGLYLESGGINLSWPTQSHCSRSLSLYSRLPYCGQPDLW